MILRALLLRCMGRWRRCRVPPHRARKRVERGRGGRGRGGVARCVRLGGRGDDGGPWRSGGDGCGDGAGAAAALHTPLVRVVVQGMLVLVARRHGQRGRGGVVREPRLPVGRRAVHGAAPGTVVLITAEDGGGHHRVAGLRVGEVGVREGQQRRRWGGGIEVYEVRVAVAIVGGVGEVQEARA
ncbi:hypothetical protein BJ912DRAFT_1002323 [Pholiota molesta]|nr:hypothetical protein BJ912DRAFT_1002323 [Pholiota molesta]